MKSFGRAENENDLEKACQELIETANDRRPDKSRPSW